VADNTGIEWVCSLCLYTPSKPPNPGPFTIINGQLVCTDHAGYVAGGGTSLPVSHGSALRTLRDLNHG
jgi:hypothetical protein